MVSLDACLAKGVDILSGTDLARLEAEILLCHVLGKDRLYLAVHKADPIRDDDAKRFLELCQRRAKGEPSAYITGIREFMSLEFEVNSSVLIPRPETEMLAELICSKYKGKNANIIDICTGSGAIACSVAHYLPDACVTAVDISKDALAVASRNCKRLGVADRVTLMRADALEKIDVSQKFDLAVSNPPYIETDVIATLEVDVKDFEPMLALDGGEDGLIFYRQIVNNIKSVLKEGGELYFEIGSSQGNDVAHIMSTQFENVTVIKDLAGLDRIVTGQLR